MSIAYVHDETQPLKTSAPDFGWRSASIGCGRTPSAGVLQGTASQPCRKVFESDVRRSLKPHPFKAPVADLEVLPQAVSAPRSMLSNQRKLY
jgi:hypothetical protein